MALKYYLSSSYTYFLSLNYMVSVSWASLLYLKIFSSFFCCCYAQMNMMSLLINLNMKIDIVEKDNYDNEQ